VIEEQVWKTNVDVKIFQELMLQCSTSNSNNTTNELDYKTRYIKFLHTNSKSMTDGSIDEPATGDGGVEKAADAVIEQIFLETTV
jgi:hypothetical protein